MKLQAVAGLVVVSLAVLRNASGQDFQNLDFEQASIAPAPSGFTPWDAYPAISAEMALPYWTVQEDGTACTAVWGAPVALDQTSVALLSPVNGYYPGYIPLLGSYSVQLYAYADVPSDYFHTASISQTGLIPLGSKSIRFLMESPPVAGGAVQANPIVTVNGTPINISPMSVSGGVMTMAGNISAYAGMTVDLTILCQATPGGFPSDENIFTLDDIQFSPSSVPEPSFFSLLTLCGLFFGLRRQCSSR